MFALKVLDQLQIPYALVGSMASGVYGEGRMTADIDILIDLQPEKSTPLCQAFSPDEFYVSENAAREAIRFRKQFNVIHVASGNKIDFMLPLDTEWGRTQMQRRRLEQIFPSTPGYVAAPEDVILSKMRYYNEGHSDKHLRDITSMMRILGNDLNYPFLDHWADELGVEHVWHAIHERLRMDDGSPNSDVPF
jgi:hypothetical protein